MQVSVHDIISTCKIMTHTYIYVCLSYTSHVCVCVWLYMCKEKEVYTPESSYELPGVRHNMGQEKNVRKKRVDERLSKKKSLRFNVWHKHILFLCKIICGECMGIKKKLIIRTQGKFRWKKRTKHRNPEGI